MSNQEPPGPLQRNYGDGDASVLHIVEKRLAEANSPEELELLTATWIQLRGEILQQNELITQQEHRRRLEGFEVIRRAGLSVAAIGVGVGLIIGGLE